MGKTAVIIGNGEFPKKAYPLYILDHADIIVCCDRALRAYLRYARSRGSDRLPDAVIGDLDSLSKDMRSKFENIIHHDADQENNDQTKAFNYIFKNCLGISQIFFIACTGKREDHTIGNVSLLMEYARELDSKSIDIDLRMVSDHTTIFPITDSTILDCGTGRKISIFSPDPSLRIRSTGLQWKTDDVVFDNWWKATLNVASEDSVSLEFSHKSMALVMMD
ncbi:MAG: thiamine diphosphokinase [Bacteroidales bacterium]|nr:thiamine diphosphokinase [Bacteroidales bacterium]